MKINEYLKEKEKNFVNVLPKTFTRDLEGNDVVQSGYLIPFDDYFVIVKLPEFETDESITEFAFPYSNICNLSIAPDCPCPNCIRDDAEFEEFYLTYNKSRRTFKQYCESLQTSYVGLMTTDLHVSTEGKPYVYIGTLIVHEDFVVFRNIAGEEKLYPFESILSITPIKYDLIRDRIEFFEKRSATQPDIQSYGENNAD